MDSTLILKFIISFLIVTLLGVKALSQKTRMVNGESQIKVEAHLSENETKEKAIQMAKINAITNEFGQYIEQESDLVLQSGKVDFRSYGQTKVKGEWVRTIGEPKFKYFIRNEGENPEKWIRCRIKGEARKAIPKANVILEILSCPQKNCRTAHFVSEENMYMYVKSPVDGYVSVYLDDGTTVYRLLPYRRMGTKKAVQIKGDQEYILFSRDIPNFNTLADQIELFTPKDQEVNTLIVVFAENEYQKPLLFDEKTGKAGFITPKSLSKKAFEEWLGENRAAFPDFIDFKRRITISTK